jgi:pilus assembly protein CpaB
MQGKALWVGALGLCLALGGAFGMSRWHQHALEVERQRSSTPVLVALRGLNQGEALGPFDFRMSAWPSDALPEGAMLDPAGLEGRVLNASLQAGEPILLSKLAPVGAATGLVQRISLGHRAISLKVSEATGVNGFVQPGHRVDVIAYLPGSASAGLAGLSTHSPAKTRSLIQDVLVLAVDREGQSDQGRPKASSIVTLEIKAEDQERFEHARQLGAVSLSLRADGDRQMLQSLGQNSASLWANERRSKSPLHHDDAKRPGAYEKATSVAQFLKPDQIAKPASPAKPDPQSCVEVIEGLKLSQECLP